MFVEAPSLLEKPVSHVQSPWLAPVLVHKPRPLHSSLVEVPSTESEAYAMFAVLTGNESWGTSPGVCVHWMVVVIVPLAQTTEPEENETDTPRIGGSASSAALTVAAFAL